MATSANKTKRHFWRWVLVVLLAPFVFWYFATPQVNFYFSEKGQGRLGYILNVQHKIYKGEIHPGQVTGGPGHIFPDDQFFFEFYWVNGEKSHCTRVRPKWPDTDVYIGPDGAIDRSRTDANVIEECGPLP